MVRSSISRIIISSFVREARAIARIFVLEVHSFVASLPQYDEVLPRLHVDTILAPHLTPMIRLKDLLLRNKHFYHLGHFNT